MHPRASVNMRRILVGQQQRLHSPNLCSLGAI
jgi:hypothetical protein